MHGTGHAYKCKPSFFLKLFIIFQRAIVWQYPLFHRKHINNGEFKALRGMKSHNRNRIFIGIMGIGIACEGDIFKKIGEIGFTIFDLKLSGCGNKFFNVGEPFLILGISASA